MKSYSFQNNLVNFSMVPLDIKHYVNFSCFYFCRIFNKKKVAEPPTLPHKDYENTQQGKLEIFCVKFENEILILTRTVLVRALFFIKNSLNDSFTVNPKINSEHVS